MIMPFDMMESRCVAPARGLLNVAHGALLTAFGISKGSRYEVVDKSSISHLVMEDATLGLAISGDITLVQVTTRARSRKARQAFHRLLCEGLAKHCGIAPSDVIVSMITTTDEDCSFSHGRTQFLTGKLELPHPDRSRSRATRTRLGNRSRTTHFAMAKAA